MQFCINGLMAVQSFAKLNMPIACAVGKRVTRLLDTSPLFVRSAITVMLSIMQYIKYGQ